MNYFSKTFVDWRRTAFPGRREVSTPRDGQGRPSYEGTAAIRRMCFLFQINLPGSSTSNRRSISLVLKPTVAHRQATEQRVDEDHAALRIDRDVVNVDVRRRVADARDIGEVVTALRPTNPENAASRAQSTKASTYHPAVHPQIGVPAFLVVQRHQT